MAKDGEYRAAKLQGGIRTLESPPRLAHRRVTPRSLVHALTPVIVKFKKTASADDKNKILDEIKKAGGTVKDTEHVESKSESWVAWGETGVRVCRHTVGRPVFL